MNYRMQLNRTKDFDLYCEEQYVFPATAVDYRVAAVEFWQEIERLRAERDELLAVCRKANANWHLTGEIPEQTADAIAAALARAETDRKDVS